ncbi:MAG: M23 family metallopeptidase [Candidatus Nanopelagicales bacterium]
MGRVSRPTCTNLPDLAPIAEGAWGITYPTPSCRLSTSIDEAPQLTRSLDWRSHDPSYPRPQTPRRCLRCARRCVCHGCRATENGVVVKAGFDGPYGNSIVIKHANGLKTRCGHLSKILIKKGEHVSAGQLIGRVGDTGNTTGPHLHFEVIKKGRPVDPEKYLWKGRSVAHL